MCEIYRNNIIKHYLLKKCKHSLYKYKHYPILYIYSQKCIIYDHHTYTWWKKIETQDMKHEYTIGIMLCYTIIVWEDDEEWRKSGTY